jgi:hypothetical protein
LYFFKVILSDVIAVIENTPGSIALRESAYVYPITESVHVLAIGMFFGTIAAIDLRLLGLAFGRIPIAGMTSRILPWTAAGFATLSVTGLMLFYAIPTRTYHSIWFRMKIALILLAGVNALSFHFHVKRRREQGVTLEVLPLWAGLAGAISLLMWVGVVISGRLIAYHWLDCDRVHSEWIRWISQCTAPGL